MKTIFDIEMVAAHVDDPEDLRRWAEARHDILPPFCKKISELRRMPVEDAVRALYLRERQRPGDVEQQNARLGYWLRELSGLSPYEGGVIACDAMGYSVGKDTPYSIREKKFCRWENFRPSRSGRASLMLKESAREEMLAYLRRYYPVLTQADIPAIRSREHPWLLPGVVDVYYGRPEDAPEEREYLLVVHDVRFRDEGGVENVNQLSIAMLAINLQAVREAGLPVSHIFLARTDMLYDSPTFGDTLPIYFSPAALEPVWKEAAPILDAYWQKAIMEGQRWETGKREKRHPSEETLLRARTLIERLAQYRAVCDEAEGRMKAVKAELDDCLRQEGIFSYAGLELGKDIPMSCRSRKTVNAEAVRQVLEDYPEWREDVMRETEDIDPVAVRHALETYPQLQDFLVSQGISFHVSTPDMDILRKRLEETDPGRIPFLTRETNFLAVSQSRDGKEAFGALRVRADSVLDMLSQQEEQMPESSSEPVFSNLFSHLHR